MTKVISVRDRKGVCWAADSAIVLAGKLHRAVLALGASAKKGFGTKLLKEAERYARRRGSRSST